MKNKLLLSGLMLLYSASPTAASYSPISELSKVATAAITIGSYLPLLKISQDELIEIGVHLGVSIITMYILIKMQMNILAGNDFFELHQPGNIKERFCSVAGNEDAKDALADIINYLQDPEKYQELGALPPKGVLLTGDPGTGKTLLARALAGEASCPFIATTGSSFSEMFVGVGSARVKKLFSLAKSQKDYFLWQKPCIIFIDEIDAVAKKRGSAFSNGEDDKTLNELLTAMDGFAKNNVPIVVIGATNHVDNLDPAILRPGRFDRVVSVALPKEEDREAILHVHLKKIKHVTNLDVKKIAKATPGFSGAELENLVNQAAIIAIKKSLPEVTMLEFEEAKDKVTIGSPMKSMRLSDYEKRVTAYHEAGHALISLLVPTPLQGLHKVTILPRAMALGITHFLPEGDIYQLSKEDLLANIAIALGGRAAEELEFNLISNGPSNDFEQATKMARAMISNYGMTDVLGKQVLLPELTQTMQYSQKTLEKIDEAVSQILEEQFTVVTSLLTEHKDKLDALAQALLEKETLDASEVYKLLSMEPRKDFRLA